MVCRPANIRSRNASRCATSTAFFNTTMPSCLKAVRACSRCSREMLPDSTSSGVMSISTTLRLLHSRISSGAARPGCLAVIARVDVPNRDGPVPVFHLVYFGLLLRTELAEIALTLLREMLHEVMVRDRKRRAGPLVKSNLVHEHDE